jgi:hypothetical protein
MLQASSGLEHFWRLMAESNVAVAPGSTWKSILVRVRLPVAIYDEPANTYPV